MFELEQNRDIKLEAINGTEYASFFGRTRRSHNCFYRLHKEAQHVRSVMTNTITFLSFAISRFIRSIASQSDRLFEASENEMLNGFVLTVVRH